MSKDMLGPLPRALMRVPDRHHGLVLDILHKLSGEQADSVRSILGKALRAPAQQQEGQSVIAITDVPGEYRAFFDALPLADRQWVLDNPLTAIPHFVRAVARAKTESLPLVQVSEARIPALEEFRVADKYREGETIDGVKVHRIRCQYAHYRGPVVERVEPAVPETALRFHRSTTHAGIKRVLSGFGDSAYITMGQLWELMKAGEEEKLVQRYRYFNYACVLGDNGVTYYLNVRYRPAAGWDVWIGTRISGPPLKYDRFVTK